MFELRSILSEKYGEDSKLIYNLDDQGGELCSLRYDLTVPFARWLAMHTDVKQIKRYQIAKVYRRDQPAIARGRLREFYQCDFDIAGIYDPMIPDAEILCIIQEVFQAFEFDVTVKLNHRRILDGLFVVAGVPADKIRSVCSSVDKLDKLPWNEVKIEIEEKGVASEVADKVGEFVQRSGSLQNVCEALISHPELSLNDDVMAGVSDMNLLLSYLTAMGIADTVSFDLSLARGLDYYSGLIYEVVPQIKGSANQVGSIAAGGRYDGLVGMYGKQPVPCVGISFGVDRIFTLLDARRKKEKKGTSELDHETDVYIMAFGGKESGGFILERMAIARELWKAGIRAEFTAKLKPRVQAQFTASDRARLTVTLGQEEVECGQVRLRSALASDKEQRDKGELVSREKLVEEVRKYLSADSG